MLRAKQHIARYEGDRLPTGTDGHGNAEDGINDNGDNLRGNQLPAALKENGWDSLDFCRRLGEYIAPTR